MKFTIIVCFIILTLAWVRSLFLPIHIDEEVFLTYGEKIHEGLMLYKHLPDHKPPGIYGISWTLGMFSSSSALLWARVITGIAHVGIAYVLYQIAKLYGLNKILSYITVLVCLSVALLYQGTFFLTETFAVLFGALAVLVLLNNQKHLNYAICLKTGVLLGFAGLYNQKAFVYIPLVLGYIWFLQNKKRAAHIGLVIFGLLATLFVPTVWFLLRDSLYEYWYWTWYFPLFEYSATNSINVLASMPKLVIPSLIIWILWGYALVKAILKPKMEQILLCMAGALPILFVVFRPYHHYVLLSVPFVTLLVVLYARQSWMQWLLLSWNLVVSLGWLIFAH